VAWIGYIDKVLKKLVFYLKLSALCLQLVFSLLFFILELILSKIDQKKFLTVLLIILLSFSLIFNFFLWQKKNTAQIIDKKIEQSLPKQESLKTEVLVLDQMSLSSLEDWYLLLEEKRLIKSQQVYLNLSWINQIKNNLNKSQEYLNKAQEIFPLEKN